MNHPCQQAVRPAPAGRWCINFQRTLVAPKPAAPATSSNAAVEAAIPARNVEPLRLEPALLGASTGFGPANATTFPTPAAVPFYIDNSWPTADLCQHQPALQFSDFAYADLYGWNGEPSSSNGAYNGSFFVHYINSALLCSHPVTSCPSTEVGEGVRLALTGDCQQLQGDLVLSNMWPPVGNALSAGGSTYRVIHH